MAGTVVVTVVVLCCTVPVESVTVCVSVRCWQPPIKIKAMTIVLILRMIVLAAMDVPASPRSEVVANDHAVLHHKADALQLRNVREGIACYRDQVGEFARLDGPDLALPA